MEFIIGWLLNEISATKSEYTEAEVGVNSGRGSGTSNYTSFSIRLASSCRTLTESKIAYFLEKIKLIFLHLASGRKHLYFESYL